MTSQTFLQLDLVLHITGFTMMAGFILADFVINRRLTRYLLTDKPRAASVMESVAVFPRLIGIGAALLIVTGIAMVVIFKGVIAQMLWFKIKMLVVLLILLNGGIVLRRNSNRLKSLLQTNDDRHNGNILQVKQRLGVFQGVELLLFLIIFVLSIFKF
ncbi:hypothetical protein [Puia dinghuensis]|uniref:DUF2214 family protein n=1 Tax=Puia dinghuensis TaxID=1792502 RepID=A0A8J2UDI6_9BACT|nr:hypothetical protein [Puia dinghuensis]GGB00422.1 hypothetical protein GCM10011511_24610 [Puia dinghuensis]